MSLLERACVYHVVRCPWGSRLGILRRIRNKSSGHTGWDNAIYVKEGLAPGAAAVLCNTTELAYLMRLLTAKSMPYMASGLYSFFIFSLVSAEARHKHDNRHFQAY